MTEPKKPSHHLSDFQDFVGVKSVQPPRDLSQAILSQVRDDLNPSAIRVFSQLLLIHAATSLVTLSVCPQFGFRVLGEGMGLMHVFMRFGEYGCLIACGVFFMGTSALLASLLLRPEEVRKIREHRVLGLAALALVSLGFFFMWDAEWVMGLTIAWFVGAWAGAGLFLELGWWMRKRQVANAAST